MKQLDLQDGIRSTVYTIIVLQLKNDPTLSVIITPDGWSTYADDEEGDNSAPTGEDTLPAIEVLPFGLAASPASLVMQESPFGIGINVATDGLDVRDLMNLWEAVEAALFKGDGNATLLKKAKTALAALPLVNGREAGQIASINLGSPAITPQQTSLGKQMMVASGTITAILRVPK